VTLDAKDAQTTRRQLRCRRASHSPETDDNDVVSVGHGPP
jgi:hypothetical protein